MHSQIEQTGVVFGLTCYVRLDLLKTYRQDTGGFSWRL